MFTVFGALGIAAIEVKSIYEKAEQKTQKDMAKAASMMLAALQKINDKELLNKLQKKL